MTEIFGKNEYKERRRIVILMLSAFIAVTVVVVAANVLIAIFLRPISNAGGLASNIVLSVIYGCGTIWFFEVPYYHNRRYRRLLRDLETGIIESGEGVFLYDGAETTVRDGVEYFVLGLEYKVDGRTESNERRLLVESRHKKPDFHLGDKIVFKSLGNILVAYEVTEQIPEDMLTEQERAISEQKFKEAAAAEQNKRKNKTKDASNGEE